jgi:hypothetical protein
MSDLRILTNCDKKTSIEIFGENGFVDSKKFPGVLFQYPDFEGEFFYPVTGERTDKLTAKIEDIDEFLYSCMRNNGEFKNGISYARTYNQLLREYRAIDGSFPESVIRINEESGERIIRDIPENNPLVLSLGDMKDETLTVGILSSRSKKIVTPREYYGLISKSYKSI